MRDFETAIFYANEQGGMMHVMWGDEETYEKIRRDGYVEFYMTDPPTQRPVAFVALVKVEKNYDFLLGRSR